MDEFNEKRVLRLHVTRQHLTEGTPFCVTRCPIALALLACGFSWASVDDDIRVQLGHRILSAHINRRLERFIYLIDEAGISNVIGWKSDKAAKIRPRVFTLHFIEI
jgi:hypothetical protein